jgi:ABC-type microcin C transport system permease subunit YejE
MPQFILVLVMIALFSPSLIMTIIAIAAVSWPSVARLVQAEVLSLRERDFVQAAVFTLIAAAVLGYEQFTVRRLAGACRAVLGVAVGLSDRLTAAL